jgi:hypothetical protein
MRNWQCPPEKGQAAREGDGLARHRADQQSADQARADRGRDGVDPVQADPGRVERVADHRVAMVEMGARGDLGDDAAMDRVKVALGQHDAGQDAAIAAHDGGGGFVAAGLDPEDG